MGTVPTKEAIIGQFINGRNATDDFLQLADNHGGNVFAWIDSVGILRGTFATNAQAAGSDTQIQFNNGGVLGADSQFSWITANKYLIAGPPKASFDSNISGVLDTPSDGVYSFRLLNSTTRISTIHAVNQCDVSIAPFHACRAIEGYVEAANVAPVGNASVYASTATAIASGGDLTANATVAAFGGTAQTASGSTTSVARMRTVDVDINHNGSGTIGVGATYLAGIGNHGTGIITLSACFYAQGTLNDGGGSITASYGYYSEKQGGVGAANYAYFAADQGTGTNDYSFYSAGGKSWLVEAAGNEALRITNIAAATSGTNQSSPSLVISGTYWNGSATAVDSYSIENVIPNGANPVNSLVFSHTGSSNGGQVDFGTLKVLLGSVDIAGRAGFSANVEILNNGPATNVLNVSSNLFKIGGAYWTGAVSAENTWTLQDVLGTGTNPTTTLTLTQSGTSGAAAISLPVTLATTLTVTAATPTGTTGQVGFGTTAGFGNGSAGTAVTTTTKSTGTGPATPQTIVNYLEIDIAGTKYWMPLVQ